VAVSSVGRCHPRVVEAIRSQAAQLMHASDLSNSRRSDLAERLATIAPPGLRGNCVTYFTQSGSDAIEAAVKFVRRVTGRHQIVAFHGAYHGIWHASNALTTGNQYRDGYGPFMSGVIHVPYPYAYRFPFDTTHKTAEQISADYLDHLLNSPYTGANDVAAVIVEPVQGEGGYIAPAPEFLQRLRSICDKSGALLIVDEIQAGAGRTGRMWSCEHSAVEPDMLTFGKGLGGDLPMAGLMMRAEHSKQIPETSQPGTFAANALSAAVCLTNIELLLDPSSNLIGRAGHLGEELKERIIAANCPFVGEVRGRGLMIGIELVESQESRVPLSRNRIGKLVLNCLHRGVIMVPCGRNGNVLRIMPPLTISRSHLYSALDILLEAVSVS
jgi:4-aminobutyrate aminotransferase